MITTKEVVRFRKKNKIKVSVIAKLEKVLPPAIYRREKVKPSQMMNTYKSFLFGAGESKNTQFKEVAQPKVVKTSADKMNIHQFLKKMDSQIAELTVRRNIVADLVKNIDQFC